MFSIFSNTRIPALIIATLGLCGTPLMGNWSMPPEVVYPSTPPPNNADNAYIAKDGKGNAIAVWFDEGTQSMLAATLASGAVNAQGQPAWVLTNPIAISNVLAPDRPYAQAVGMDANGNAIAVYTSNIDLLASMLPFGQINWSTPFKLNPIQGLNFIEPYIAIAANGNAVVTWTSDTTTYSGTIYANVYDASTQSWKGQQDILNGAIELDLYVNPVAVDSVGNAVVAVTDTSNNAQAARYNFQSNTWTSFTSVASTPIVIQSVAMDSAGNATIIWLEQNNTVNAATLFANQSSLTNKVQLSSTGTIPAAYSPLVAVDASGNVVAVWSDASGALASARYSAATKNWTVLPLLNLGGLDPFYISLSGDALGNAVATWTIFQSNDPAQPSFIEAASLANSDSSWTLLTQLSPSSESVGFSNVALTSNDDAVAIWWKNDFTGGPGTIYSSIFLGMFHNLIFTGKVVKDQFLTQTDRIHQLNWTAIPSSVIVEYRLYRNSVLIATIPAVGSSFSYQDHNRSKKVSDTYTLTSMKANGVVDQSLTLTLQ